MPRDPRSVPDDDSVADHIEQRRSAAEDMADEPIPVLLRVVPTNLACIECSEQLGLLGGYERTGLCGPCATGEADEPGTVSEYGVTW